MNRLLLPAVLVLLAVNAVFAALWWRAQRETLELQKGANEVAAALLESEKSRAECAAAALRADAAALKQRADIWRSLQSDDLPALVANLRAAGFPDPQARAVVASVLGARYEAKRRALLGAEDVPPFWKARPAGAGLDPAKQAELRTLAREQRDQLKRLFGAEAEGEESRFYQQRLYGPLPPDKLEGVARIAGDYAELTGQIQTDAGGMLLPEDRENLAMLEQEKRKDLAALLTPAELELYDLYSSGTATTLRRNLASFNPTEAEFRAIFALQRDFDEAHGRNSLSTTMLGLLDERSMQDRTSSIQKLNEQVRAALGDARYQEYQRAQDPGYRVAARIAERYRLPAENAVAVYALQKEAQQRLVSLRGDREAAAGYLRETSARLQQLLGPKGVEAYRQSTGSLWLRSLDRMATPPVPAGVPRG